LRVGRLKFVEAVAVFSVAAGVPFLSVAADQPTTPTISKSIAKPMKAAQDALKDKKFDEALAALKEAQAAPGPKTDYDNYVINQDLLYCYVQAKDYTSAIPMLESLTQSVYATPDQLKTWLKALFGIYYQNKNYDKTVELGQVIIKKGFADDEVLKTMGDSQKKLGNPKDAAATIEQITSHQDKPDENLLQFQWNCYVEAKDDPDGVKVLDRLLTFYPKPEYWQNALVPLRRMDLKDSHLQLNIYRLMSAVGILKSQADYADMAEIAQQAGFPGEAVAVLQQAFQNNVFVQPKDKDRYQHELDSAKQRATSDQASLGKSEPTDGNAIVQLGAAYMSYGQYEKAIDYINKGLQKGGLKSVDDANLLLGIAQLRAKNNAEAQKLFDKVAASSEASYADLGRLWSLHARAPSA